MTDKDGIYTMTETEFDRELATAWDEGFRDGLRQDAEGDDGPRFENPYRIKLAVNAAIKTANAIGIRGLL